MNKLIKTKHAILRLQQRGISTDIAEFIYEHGEKIRTISHIDIFLQKSAQEHIRN